MPDYATKAQATNEKIIGRMYNQMDILEKLVNRLNERSEALCGPRLREVPDNALNVSGSLNTILLRMVQLEGAIRHVDETLNQAVD